MKTNRINKAKNIPIILLLLTMILVIAVGKVSAFESASDVDKFYPVGSIYQSTVATSPETLFGGTWTPLENRFLLGAGSTYTAGATGGEATHKLTIAEMPSHTHSFSGISSGTNSNSHSHTVPNTKGISSSGPTSAESWANAPASGRTLTTSSNSHSHTVVPKGSNGYTGGNAEHNNLPPYEVVYMWSRTA